MRVRSPGLGGLFGRCRIRNGTRTLLARGTIGGVSAIRLVRGSIQFGVVYWKALRALAILLAHTYNPLVRFAC